MACRIAGVFTARRAECRASEFDSAEFGVNKWRKTPKQTTRSRDLFARRPDCRIRRRLAAEEICGPACLWKDMPPLGSRHARSARLQATGQLLVPRLQPPECTLLKPGIARRVLPPLRKMTKAAPLAVDFTSPRTTARSTARLHDKRAATARPTPHASGHRPCAAYAQRAPSRRSSTSAGRCYSRNALLERPRRGTRFGASEGAET